jgi:hypothetical protein
MCVPLSSHEIKDYILYMTSRLFVSVHSIALSTLLTLTCLTPHSNDMTSLQNSSAENITQKLDIVMISNVNGLLEVSVMISLSLGNGL